MWAEPLAELLSGLPHVQIVLSTSWVRHIPFEQVRELLPMPLRRRVIGSTWHCILHDPEYSRNLPMTYWHASSRYQQVRRWVRLHRLRKWVAIDDDAECWHEPERLVQTNPDLGLSDPVVVARLSDLLMKAP